MNQDTTRDALIAQIERTDQTIAYLRGRLSAADGPLAVARAAEDRGEEVLHPSTEIEAYLTLMIQQMNGLREMLSGDLARLDGTATEQER